MTHFWVKEAIDILRQNGSREPADAVEALAARLAYVTQTLAPLAMPDDNRPVEALARLALVRLAEAERALADANNTVAEAWEYDHELKMLLLEARDCLSATSKSMWAESMIFRIDRKMNADSASQ